MKTILKKILKPRIPVIKIQGKITEFVAQETMKFLSRTNTINAVALAVLVNSRGGFPAQSESIASKLRAFAREKDLKLYTFTNDAALSGGYAILAAGDEAYAQNTSLVGSIGVVWKRYSFQDLPKKLGVNVQLVETRQTMNKLLNPFTKLEQKDREFLQFLSEQGHKNFISLIKQYRNGKLNLQNEKQLFSGSAFTGEQALHYGLIDGIGTPISVLDKKYPGCELAYQNIYVLNNQNL